MSKCIIILNFFKEVAKNDFVNKLPYEEVPGAALERCTGAKCTVNFDDIYKLSVEFEILKVHQNLMRL